MRRVIKVIVFLMPLVLMGQIIPIHEIQSNRLPGSDTSFYFGQTVTTTGIAISDVGQVAGSRVFYLEEAQGGPWSGIQCYFVSNSIVVPVSQGDSLIVTGQVSEYYGNTEIVITSSSDVQIISTGHPLPPPNDIPCGYLDTTATSMYDPDSAEAYEGTLVQLSNTYVTSTSGPQGDWEVTDGTGYVYIRNNGNYTYVPQLGDNVTVRGPVRVYYGFFRVEPRSDDDIEVHVLHLSIAYSVGRDSVHVVFTAPVDATSASNPSNYTISGGVTVLSATRDAENPKLVRLNTTPMTDETLYTLYVSNVQDTMGNTMPPDSTDFWGGFVSITTIQSDTADSGISAWLDRMVTVTGICTVDSTASSWYYIEEAQGGPFSGIMVYDYDHEPLMGDSVILVGSVYEYYLNTEITDVLFFRVVSSGHPLPDPIPINTGDLSAGSPYAEQYEGVLVMVDTSWVVDPNPTGPYFEIDDGSGICRVGNRNAYVYEPHQGDTIGVTGVVRYVGGGYTIEPRSDSDFVFIYVDVKEANGNSPLWFNKVYPTVARSEVYLKLGLSRSAPVEISIYDVTGRLVRAMKRKLEPGEHIIKIKRGNLRSGVYFLRVNTGGIRKTYEFLFMR